MELNLNEYVGFFNTDHEEVAYSLADAIRGETHWYEETMYFEVYTEDQIDRERMAPLFEYDGQLYTEETLPTEDEREYEYDYVAGYKMVGVTPWGHETPTSGTYVEVDGFYFEWQIL
jgi:hypothetical protein